MKRLIVTGFAVAAMLVTALALRHAGAQQSGPGPANAPYTPALGDIMGLTQLRHFKLAYAGQLGNWPLANYELGQIQDSFASAARLYPTFKSIPLAQLIKDESEPALADLGKAIAAKDGPNFAKAFAKLTDACNRCHQAAGWALSS